LRHDNAVGHYDAADVPETEKTASCGRGAFTICDLEFCQS